MTGIDEVMREIPGGSNQGRKTSTDPNKEGQRLELSEEAQQAAEFMREEAGFGIVETTRGRGGIPGTTYGAQDAGMTAHRGVLDEGEYVDPFVLRDAACDLLGFTYDEITSVYRQGPLSPEQRQLRARIDARLLALSRSGGNMTQLADALNVAQSAVDRAVKRAKSLWVEPIVKNPAVKTDRVCFIEGTRDATPRRRRFSKSPEQWVGQINLSERAYARGFETKPGSAAYWEFKDRRMPVGV